ncbi:MAG TPA: cation diffusion facilitator family transporter [Chitinophagales bacterium]|nr:cation diffusion facilitator family transporter [Chitinophagales bacterium]HNF70108.1 cation diffusion facilitator family transporter [Chitinophagales bacterium]HNJ88649.1 cation diffusion facilitator family transporter [Chitinophagales bacterium]HNK98620.1 cation diffusion facilitator family transporter [Chitinophagales bacterium]HNM07244.1 cation diffusion facilitator family transporter [Chitinophagales bacterium]
MMDEQRMNIRLQKIVVAIAIILLLVKFSAYLLTHSNAILTDALESIVNVVAGAFGLYSLILASKPRDINHPYGHGKIEFISASIEGSMITLAGVLIIGKSIFNLLYPQTIQNVESGIILVAIAGTVNFAMGIFMERRGKKANSLILIAGGKHLQSDGWSTAGLLVGLGLLLIFKKPCIDSAVALLFGAYIAYEGYQILRKSVAGIMDEADTELLRSLIDTFEKHREDDWIDIHNLRVIKYGANLHFDCHLTVPYYYSVKEGHDALERMESLIHVHHETSDEWFVHIDACVPPAMCKICTKRDCQHRQSPLESRIEWNLENVLRNQKHGLYGPTIDPTEVD